MDGKKYLYRGKVLEVRQKLSDLKYGIILNSFGTYRWMKNKSIGSYREEEEAQAALDEFAAKLGLEECA